MLRAVQVLAKDDLAFFLGVDPHIAKETVKLLLEYVGLFARPARHALSPALPAAALLLGNLAQPNLDQALQRAPEQRFVARIVQQHKLDRLAAGRKRHDSAAKAVGGVVRDLAAHIEKLIGR